MSTPRLTFLYPFLFAPVRGAPFRGEVSKTGRQVFRTAARRSQTQRPVRYGKANEPLIYIGTDKGLAPSRPSDATAPPDEEALAQPRSKTNTPPPTSKESAPSHAPQSPLMDAQESHPTALASNTLHVPEKNPLETVLHVPQPDNKDASTPTDKETKDNAPDAQQQQQQQQQQITDQVKDQRSRPRPPHIDTPAFVHHFDTYGLVKRLEDGGWTQAQAVTIMKAVRLTISDNMDLASSALVSKSNVENETYLFKAACSELHTEIYTKRKGGAERSRTERTQLQHEVDILGQRLTQEGGNLKDELKGMFDDRKMAVQNEQRDIERKCQELNYRITIILNSDSRSDVENVRWLITKRAISALAICVAMILGSLKFSSTAQAWAEEEKKRAAAVVSNNPTNGSASASASGHQDEFFRDHGNGGERQGEMMVRQGDNPAFVSLG